MRVDPANPAWTVIRSVPGTPTGRTFIYNTDPAQGPVSIFANGTAAVGNRNIEAARLGPDGKLYFIMQGSGDIWRVRNPLTPTMTPQGNAIERVGTSDNGKVLLSIGWVGHDLWMQQAGFLNGIFLDEPPRSQPSSSQGTGRAFKADFEISQCTVLVTRRDVC